MNAAMAAISAALAAAIFADAMASGGLSRAWAWLSRSRDGFFDWRRRARSFRQWPQALLFLAGAVSAGATLDDAFDHLAREAPEPLRSRIARGSRALDTESRVRRVMDDPGLRFARAALILYVKTGGRVGRLLETTASVLQDRVEAEARVGALTAQGRVSAWIVALTPFGLGGAMAWLAPDLAAPLVRTGAGRAVLLAAAALVTLGLVIAQRLARVEP